ncbi:hypothetical protein EDD86DRAFT_131118 [Gorgonomyces haynaldii]|nr:hypothetical protein EDD86DRAFT_131118 [Gorgonomyces haynaldii]
MPKNLDDEFEEFNTSDQNLLDALMQVEASEVPRTQVSVDLNMLQDEFDDEDFLLDEAILKEADIIASQVLQDQSLPRPTSPKFHRTQLFASQHLPLFEKENVPTPNIVLNQLQQEKASLQQDILTKSGELSILRQNMKRLNTENAELKTRLLQQTSLTTQQHRSVTEELKSKVQELESRLRFKEQEMISLRMSRKRSSLSRSVSEPKPELTMTVGVGTEPLKPSKTSDVFLVLEFIIVCPETVSVSRSVSRHGPANDRVSVKTSDGEDTCSVFI